MTSAPEMSTTGDHDKSNAVFEKVMSGFDGRGRTAGEIIETIELEGPSPSEFLPVTLKPYSTPDERPPTTTPAPLLTRTDSLCRFCPGATTKTTHCKALLFAVSQKSVTLPTPLGFTDTFGRAGRAGAEVICVTGPIPAAFFAKTSTL
jgi:hypothetical protein